jgi:hypothetical protein
LQQQQKNASRNKKDACEEEENGRRYKYHQASYTKTRVDYGEWAKYSDFDGTLVAVLFAGCRDR